MIDPLLLFIVIVVVTAAAVTFGLHNADSFRLWCHQRRDEAERQAQAARQAASEKAQTEQRLAAEAAAAQRRQWQDHTYDMLGASFRALQARLVPTRHRAATAKNDADAAEKKAAKLEAELGPRADNAAFRIVVAVLAAIWAIMFFLQIYLDYTILHGLHTLPLAGAVEQAVSAALGVAAAMIISGVALVLVAMFGGHGTLITLKKNAKRAIGVWCCAFLVLVVGGLVWIAPARSDLTVGKQVSIAAKSVDLAERQLDAAGRRTPPSPAAVAGAQAQVNSARTDLTSATDRLASSRATDRLYALLVPATEILLSWFALTAGELLQLRAARRRRERLRKAQKEAEQPVVRDTQEWEAEMARTLTIHGVPLDRLDTFAARQAAQRSRQGEPGEAGVDPRTEPNADQGANQGPAAGPSQPASNDSNDSPRPTEGTAGPSPGRGWSPPSATSPIPAPQPPQAPNPPTQPLAEEWNETV